MMEKKLLHAASHRKQAYLSPEVEILHARVEKGFAGSGNPISGQSTGEGLGNSGSGNNALFT